MRISKSRATKKVERCEEDCIRNIIRVGHDVGPAGVIAAMSSILATTVCLLEALEDMPAEETLPQINQLVIDALSDDRERMVAKMRRHADEHG